MCTAEGRDEKAVVINVSEPSAAMAFNFIFLGGGWGRNNLVLEVICSIIPAKDKNI